MSVVSFPSGQSAAYPSDRPAIFPPGPIGDVAHFIYCAAPHPNATIALAAAFGFFAGIAGRPFKIKGAGLNLYVLILARTGAGKGAAKGGIDKLFTALQRNAPGIAECRGPGELPSGPGLLKFLAKLSNPCVVSVIGEFPHMLKAMGSHNPNAILLMRTLLDLFDKSGAGSSVDPAAYSDPDKRTASIPSPSFTFVGEGTPEGFFEAQDERTVANGFVPRFLIFETDEPRPYENETPTTEPPEHILHTLGCVARECLSLAHAGHFRDVGMTDEAAAKFREFSRWTTDRVNDVSASLANRECWNRANLNARKIAALNAVARDPVNPVITLDECLWATDMIYRLTLNVIAKFEDGEVGDASNNETKQQNEVLRCIGEYLSAEFNLIPKSYGVIYELQSSGIVTEKYLSMRLIGTPTFKNDRIGATNALKRAISNLLEADDLKEVPKQQVELLSGRRPRAFTVASPSRLAEAMRKKGKRGV